jgi:hypothetical protein
MGSAFQKAILSSMNLNWRVPTSLITLAAMSEQLESALTVGTFRLSPNDRGDEARSRAVPGEAGYQALRRRRRVPDALRRRLPGNWSLRNLTHRARMDYGFRISLTDRSPYELASGGCLTRLSLARPTAFGPRWSLRLVPSEENQFPGSDIKEVEAGPIE